MAIDEKALEIKLREMLSTGGIVGVQFVWPNQQADESQPYATVQYVPVRANDDTIAGDDYGVDALLIVNLATKIGTGTDFSLTFAEQVKAIFPLGTRIDLGSSMVEVQKHPERKSSYRDGTSWRTPIQISISAS